jgi:metal-sulfur cluster biosynthetic enzyme
MDTATRERTQSQIYEALRHVYDPELGINVIDLGLVYDVDVDERGHVTIDMTLTTSGCPMNEALAEGVGAALQEIPGISNGELRLVWDPPWDPSRLTEEGRRMLGLD